MIKRSYFIRVRHYKNNESTEFIEQFVTFDKRSFFAKPHHVLRDAVNKAAIDLEVHPSELLVQQFNRI